MAASFFFVLYRHSICVCVCMYIPLFVPHHCTWPYKCESILVKFPRSFRGKVNQSRVTRHMARTFIHMISSEAIPFGTFQWVEMHLLPFSLCFIMFRVIYFRIYGVFRCNANRKYKQISCIVCTCLRKSHLGKQIFWCLEWMFLFFFCVLVCVKDDKITEVH